MVHWQRIRISRRGVTAGLGWPEHDHGSSESSPRAGLPRHSAMRRPLAGCQCLAAASPSVAAAASTEWPSAEGLSGEWPQAAPSHLQEPESKTVTPKFRVPLSLLVSPAS